MIKHEPKSTGWDKEPDGSIRQYETQFDWTNYLVFNQLAGSFMPDMIGRLSGPPFFKKDVATLRWEQDAQTGKKLLVIGHTDYNDGRRLGLARNELLLDPERGMIPVKRRAMYPDGRIGREDTIEYEKAPTADGIYIVREVIAKDYRDNIEPASRLIRTQVVKTTINGEVNPAEFTTTAPLDEPIHKELARRQSEFPDFLTHARSQP